MSPDELQNPESLPSLPSDAVEHSESAGEDDPVVLGDIWGNPTPPNSGSEAIAPSIEQPSLAEPGSSSTPDTIESSGVPQNTTGIPINLSFNASTSPASNVSDLPPDLLTLQQQKQQLQQDIADLQTTYDRMRQNQTSELQNALGRLIQEGLSELEQRKQALQLSIEQLERRQERIKAEMRSTFAGASQDLAIRVQGFKDYLVGSLQDLVVVAEEMKLAAPPPAPVESRRAPTREDAPVASPKFTEDAFENQAKQIRRLLDQYRTQPDYYGPTWQLRRTFEPIHAERVANWFFTQGGRGALRTMGSRLQNILIASTIISVLRKMHGDRLRTLILADSPERLGEWRRGLQDCLGISRADFGSDQGVVLFDAPEPLAQRADRLIKQKQIPLIIMDESEDVVSLSLLQFPLWLAFAADPMNSPTY